MLTFVVLHSAKSCVYGSWKCLSRYEVFGKGLGHHIQCAGNNIRVALE